MSNTMLSLYAKTVSSSNSEIGLLMSMFAITALCCRFVAGPAIDSFNQKLLVMGAMSIMAASYIGFAFSNSISTLYIFRLVQGVGSGFGNVCLMTMVADTLPHDKFNTGMGYYAVASVVAQALGPTFGRLIVDMFGGIELSAAYTKLYLITCGIQVSAILVSTKIISAPHQPKKFVLSPQNAVAKEAVIPAFVTFCVQMGFVIITSWLYIYAVSRGVYSPAISLFFTIQACTMLISRPLIGKLTDRYGFVKVGMPAICATITSFFIISGAASLKMLLVASAVNAFGFGAILPTLQSLAVKSVPHSRRGTASGTNFIGQDAATIIGPSLSGQIADFFARQRPGLVAANPDYFAPEVWMLMTVPMFIGIAIIIVFRKRIDRIESGFREENASGKNVVDQPAIW